MFTKVFCLLCVKYLLSPFSAHTSFFVFGSVHFSLFHFVRCYHKMVVLQTIVIRLVCCSQSNGNEANIKCVIVKEHRFQIKLSRKGHQTSENFEWFGRRDKSDEWKWKKKNNRLHNKTKPKKRRKSHAHNWIVRERQSDDFKCECDRIICHPNNDNN